MLSMVLSDSEPSQPRTEPESSSNIHVIGQVILTGNDMRASGGVLESCRAAGLYTWIYDGQSVQVTPAQKATVTMRLLDGVLIEEGRCSFGFIGSVEQSDEYHFRIASWESSISHAEAFARTDNGVETITVYIRP